MQRRQQLIRAVKEAKKVNTGAPLRWRTLAAARHGVDASYNPEEYSNDFLQEFLESEGKMVYEPREPRQTNHNNAIQASSKAVAGPKRSTPAAGDSCDEPGDSPVHKKKKKKKSKGRASNSAAYDSRSRSRSRTASRGAERGSAHADRTTTHQLRAQAREGAPADALDMAKELKARATHMTGEGAQLRILAIELIKTLQNERDDRVHRR